MDDRFSVQLESIIAYYDRDPNRYLDINDIAKEDLTELAAMCLKDEIKHGKCGEATDWMDNKKLLRNLPHYLVQVVLETPGSGNQQKAVNELIHTCKDALLEYYKDHIQEELDKYLIEHCPKYQAEQRANEDNERAELASYNRNRM